MIQSDNLFAQPGFGLAQGTAPCGLTGVKKILATNFLGTIFPSDDIEAIVGQLYLDGSGNITSGAETFSIGGTITVVPVTGTYTEGNDCRGTVQIIGASTMNFNTVVVNGGKELLMIETDNSTLLPGTAQQ
jgi:hypothetical protein